MTGNIVFYILKHCNKMKSTFTVLFYSDNLSNNCV